MQGGDAAFIHIRSYNYDKGPDPRNAGHSKADVEFDKWPWIPMEPGFQSPLGCKGLACGSRPDILPVECRDRRYTNLRELSLESGRCCSLGALRRQHKRAR